MKLFKFFYDEEVFEKINFLKNIRLFCGINEKDLIYILESLTERIYLKGETVFTQGDIGRALFIIVSGKITLTVFDKETKKTKQIAEVHPGEMFGEMALLEEMPRTATATAAEDTKVLMMFNSKLENLFLSKPKIGIIIATQLAKVMSSRLRAKIETAEAMVMRNRRSTDK
ncbi:MAG: Crp/Fnr family transcriptional regulator [Elusimicrobiales bacterium]|nr:Crp/Fnr family transcriptional regulator [Elusimicrobiales bacterium]MCK5582170.1 Crp/Fnr family transcriptional regulator [Elusimicrobiales bacterium]